MEFGGDEDLSCDAEPTMDLTPEVTEGNQPAQDGYSFISQLWSQRERDDYHNKIKIIKKWKVNDLTDFGDVLLLCSKEDMEEASIYCDYLGTLRMRGGPGQAGISVKASLMENEVLPGQLVISESENSLERYTFAFLYVTKTSSFDGMYSYFQEMCLTKEKREEKEEGCLAVVYSDDVDTADIALRLQGELSICASDMSKDTENALIKKLESKLYLREAKEKQFIEEKFEEADKLEKSTNGNYY